MLAKPRLLRGRPHSSANVASMRVGLATAFLLTFVAACTRAPGSNEPGGRHSWTQPHVLRIAMPSDPDSLNPYRSELDVSYGLASLVYSYLIVADDRNRLVGDLATQVPTLSNGGISRDGRTYTYHLRRGVRWHDGAAFTARDVVASWRAIVDPKRPVLDREGFDRIESVGAPDPYTVVVRLRSPYPPFVTHFFAPLQEGAKPVLPAHVLAIDRDFNDGALEKHPMGTGSFVFVSWTRSDRIELRRFESYFRGRPALARIELRTIENPATAAAELTAHRLDLISTAPTALLPQYRSIDGARVAMESANFQTLLLIDNANRALHEPDVRRAVALSVPYATILDDVTHNVFEPALNSIAPTALGYEPLAARRYDPTAAARLLDARGWRRGPDGVRSRHNQRLSLTLATLAGATTFDRIAVLLQSSFERAGIELTIKAYPYNVYGSPAGPIYGGRYDLALFGETLDWDPDQYDSLACDRWYPQGGNVLRFCDPLVDGLERAGLATADPRERARIYRAAGRRIWSVFPNVPLYQGRRLFVASVDLRNYRPNATSTPWWNAWEWDI
jgi:peptide/nickel transport system substrate-binding protein